MISRPFRSVRCAVVLVCLASWASESTVAPQFSHSGPKSAAYGERQGFPVGDLHTWSDLPHLVGSYSHFDAIFPARGIPHAPDSGISDGILPRGGSPTDSTGARTRSTTTSPRSR
jgi:hypothetical protein